MGNSKELTRNQKFKLNTITALIKQIAALISGLILPRFILLYYGSDVNGLISSITQFLDFITLLEMGIGPVIQSNLYKPLAEKDNKMISKIYASASKFFKKIGYIFIIYIIVLIVFYPRLVNSNFDYGFTVSLIVIISLSTLAEYFFGMTYQLLLNADQLAWVQLSVQTMCIFANAIICILLIVNGQDIRWVKGVTSIIYVIKPCLLATYVHKHYDIDFHITYSEEPIKQKWNGFTQHLAAVVNSRTDVIILTIASTLSNVSIYNIYFLIVNGIEQIIMTAMTGLEAMWGNMLANKEIISLNKSFSTVEAMVHFLVSLLFSVTAILITPFVLWYTRGVTDANYNAPIFGMLLSFAYAVECYRIPYFRMIKAAGHYKQTQWASLIQPCINIAISVLAVKRFGLIGVAIGTFVAMLYHTIYFAWYLKDNIINRPFVFFVKHMIVDLMTIMLILLTCNPLVGWMNINTIGTWIVGAIIVLSLATAESLLISFVFYSRETKEMLNTFHRKVFGR
ncbi:lipopolysaccharide biosynthesis protein [Galactobacillus timonensis]|uniref:lipopolysaccharide biosynthesis protein n=1 Tax=Galactobacillus timonensis TaxID=2041840 RepID=UPI0014368A42|nr:polysaccharide biosynthesis C-terminal domain-containing protein [Galactobacillus timonensis]